MDAIKPEYLRTIEPGRDTPIGPFAVNGIVLPTGKIRLRLFTGEAAARIRESKVKVRRKGPWRHKPQEG